MAKKVFITGITGQDGSYLAEFLLDKGYEVHGFMRRASTSSIERIEHIRDKVTLHHGDLLDGASLHRAIFEVQPDEVYNLAAQSHVGTSFKVPDYTAQATGLGVLRLLEAIRDFQDESGKQVKFYQASSSEMFGSTPPPQNEDTRFYPRSPYGAAKMFAHNITVNYRESFDVFGVCGILFNHESPRRGENFVTKKIAREAARIKMRLSDKLYLGNLEAKRDWGYAPEYMEAAWLMMQQDEPDDYVIGTGEAHSVEDFVRAAFAAVDIADWEKYVEIDPKFYRPAEVNHLAADYSKAKEKLGWEPKVSFEELVKIMVEADSEKLNRLKS